MSPRFMVELTLRRHPALRQAGIAALLAAAAWLVLAPLPSGRPPADSGVALRRAADDGHRAFRAVLAPRHDIEAREQDVLAMAAGHGLSAGRIDYGAERSEDGRFGKFSMAFSVQGSFPALRNFLANALARHPEIAITSLSVQRAATGSNVEAQVRLVLFADAEAGR